MGVGRKSGIGLSSLAISSKCPSRSEDKFVVEMPSPRSLSAKRPHVRISKARGWSSCSSVEPHVGRHCQFLLLSRPRDGGWRYRAENWAFLGQPIIGRVMSQVRGCLTSPRLLASTGKLEDPKEPKMRVYMRYSYPREARGCWRYSAIPRPVTDNRFACN